MLTDTLRWSHPRGSKVVPSRWQATRVIILDTNVVSEVMRRRPDIHVIGWLESLSGDVAITAVTLAEILAGVRRLLSGRRKSALRAKIRDAVEPYRATGAVLAFDDDAADRYADVLAARESAGLPIGMAEAQIAAICRALAAACATQNTKDFERTGIELINPWTA